MSTFGLSLCHVQQRVLRGDTEELLSLIEFQLLEQMMRFSDESLMHEELKASVHVLQMPDRILEQHLRRLDRKLRALVPERPLLHRIGIGFMYSEKARSELV